MSEIPRYCYLGTENLWLLDACIPYNAYFTDGVSSVGKVTVHNPAGIIQASLGQICIHASIMLVNTCHFPLWPVNTYHIDKHELRPTLAWLMAWCSQAASNYLVQCWTCIFAWIVFFKVNCTHRFSWWFFAIRLQAIVWNNAFHTSVNQIYIDAFIMSVNINY